MNSFQGGDYFSEINDWQLIPNYHDCIYLVC